MSASKELEAEWEKRRRSAQTVGLDFDTKPNPNPQPQPESESVDTAVKRLQDASKKYSEALRGEGVVVAPATNEPTAALKEEWAKRERTRERLETK